MSQIQPGKLSRDRIDFTLCSFAKLDLPPNANLNEHDGEVAPLRSARITPATRTALRLVTDKIDELRDAIEAHCPIYTEYLETAGAETSKQFYDDHVLAIRAAKRRIDRDKADLDARAVLEYARVMIDKNFIPDSCGDLAELATLPIDDRLWTAQSYPELTEAVARFRLALGV